jgi:hypothetical protein
MCLIAMTAKDFQWIALSLDGAEAAGREERERQQVSEEAVR